MTRFLLKWLHYLVYVCVLPSFSSIQLLSGNDLRFAWAKVQFMHLCPSSFGKHPSFTAADGSENTALPQTWQR